MKNSILTFVLLFISFTAFSQASDSLVIAQLQQTVGQLRTELKNQKTAFTEQITTVNKEIENLQAQIEEMQNAVESRAESLDNKITDTRTTAEQQIANVNNSLGKTTLWAIIGILFAVIASGVVYWLLRKRQKTDRTDMIEQLSNTKSSIEERLVKEFGKQTELMDTQMELLKQQKIGANAVNAELDHSLALKLADEITLMERNISLMDTNTKGLKQLNRSIGKLKDNLAANGYEIPELLGKPYNDGLKVIITNTVQDENLEKGVELITKIIKPQVNFNDKMIQAAQIEVSVG